MRSLLIAALAGVVLSLSGCGQRSQEPEEMEATKKECASKGMDWGIQKFGFFYHGLERVVCVKKS